MRAVLGAVALFILFRLARAARRGRVRFARETFSRAEMPLVYWREMALDALTLSLLAALVLWDRPWDDSRPGWTGVAIGSFSLFLILIRELFPRGERRLRDVFNPNEIALALVATAAIVGAVILILKWVGF